ncbi:redox-regulated ATPase YchF [Methanocaldococcus infernus]|uniref:redox-regulated ATPase YchF n=1 Tax=Methanocaldococcus infernus TaxID=67760 RepID=UPI0018DBF556|nr:redox-regulated ATPase YchF [Methanocaldococcus infernus]
MLLIGLVGKPNVGKSTFFNALTEKEVDIGNYPFTTIEPNKGIGFITSECPCKELNLKCNPRNSKCIDGIRYIPVEVVDVAGLVPGAYEGRGMGNKFLDDLRQADAFILVVDASGRTDKEGNIGEGDPVEDVKFLLEELDMWIYKILSKNWDKLLRRAQQEKNIVKLLKDQLSGLNISEEDIKMAIRDFDESLMKWKEEDLLELAKRLRKISKPFIIAANKADLPEAEENIKRLKREFKDYLVIPTSAEIELALKRAEKSGIIKRVFDREKEDFIILDESKLSPQMKRALDYIKEFLDKYGSTGVQKCLNEAYFNLLNSIVVYPVEDENKFSDKEGNVLPDAFLMRKGDTARDLAYKIHTDLGERFLYAIDARKKIRLGADYELKHNDIIKIVAVR